MTLRGAQHLLHTDREGATKTAEVIEKLLDIKQQLKEIRDQMAEE